MKGPCRHNIILSHPFSGAKGETDHEHRSDEFFDVGTPVFAMFHTPSCDTQHEAGGEQFGGIVKETAQRKDLGLDHVFEFFCCCLGSNTHLVLEM